MVRLKASLNVPKRFLLAAGEPCRCAALGKAATNWTLTTATSVRHAQRGGNRACAAPDQSARRAGATSGSHPPDKKRAGRGRGFTGTGSMAHFLCLCFLFGRLGLHARMCTHVCSSDFSWTRVRPLRSEVGVSACFFSFKSTGFGAHPVKGHPVPCWPSSLPEFLNRETGS